MKAKQNSLDKTSVGKERSNSNDIHKEITYYSNKCFDVLQHNQRIQKFKEIYKNKFGVELTDKEALDYAIILFNFVKLIVNLSKK